MSDSTTEVPTDVSTEPQEVAPQVLQNITYKADLPSSVNVDLFNQAYTKTREELTPEEFRAIIACYGWLDNDERAKFAVTRADLLPEEIVTYDKSLLLNVYWPV